MDARSMVSHSQLNSNPVNQLLPRDDGRRSVLGWTLYRCGLVLTGIVWIFVASTFCGCRAASGWMMNESGKGYYNSGYYTAARYEFERALIDDPYNPTYAHNLAKALQKEGDLAHSEQMFQHALRLDPSHQPSYHGLSELLISQGRQDDARTLLQAWAETQPYVPESHIELARYHRRQGDYGSAEQRLHQALRLNPHQPQAIEQLGLVYQQTGRPAAASAQYQQALMMNPMQPDISTRLTTLPHSHLPSPGMHMVQTMPQHDLTLVGGFPSPMHMHGSTMHMAAPPAPMQMSSPPLPGEAMTLYPPVQPMPAMTMQGAPIPTYSAPYHTHAAPYSPYAAPPVTGSGWGPTTQQFSPTVAMPSSPVPVNGPATYYGPALPSAPQMPAPAVHYSTPQPGMMAPYGAQPVELGPPVPVTHMVPQGVPLIGSPAPAVNAF